MQHNNEYHLDRVIGPETLDREYKLFCYRRYGTVSSTKWQFILNNGMTIEDAHLIHRITQSHIICYMRKYLAKYISIFANTSITTGTILIGIDDDGRVDGIPFFQGCDNILINRDIILECIRNNLMIDHDTDKVIINWLADNIKIQYHKIHTHQALLDESYMERYMGFVDKVRRSEKTWSEYKKKFSQWYDQLQRYTRKLSMMMNDQSIRDELIKYIIEHPEYHKRKLVIDQLITTLKIEPIDHNIANSLMDIDMLERIREDWTNPYKWLIEFKETMVGMIQQIKPKRPQKELMRFDVRLFCKNIQNIRTPLCNNGFDLYVIEITIPLPSELINNKRFYYRNHTDCWTFHRRVVQKEGPISY